MLINATWYGTHFALGGPSQLWKEMLEEQQYNCFFGLLFTVSQYYAHVLTDSLTPQGDGFQGRPNKPLDSCCSFWVGATMMLLGGLHLVDTAGVRAFHLSCQNTVLGEPKATFLCSAQEFTLFGCTPTLSSSLSRKQVAFAVSNLCLSHANQRQFYACRTPV